MEISATQQQNLNRMASRFGHRNARRDASKRQKICRMNANRAYSAVNPHPNPTRPACQRRSRRRICYNCRKLSEHRKELYANRFPPDPTLGASDKISKFTQNAHLSLPKLAAQDSARFTEPNLSPLHERRLGYPQLRVATRHDNFRTPSKIPNVKTANDSQ